MVRRPGLAPIILLAPALFVSSSAGAARSRRMWRLAKRLAEACSGCHGADGVSQEPVTPSLAGEPDEFVQWQLVYFRSGSRRNEVMQPIAQALSNEEIRNLGAYYASLPPPRPQPAN